MSFSVEEIRHWVSGEWSNVQESTQIAGKIRAEKPAPIAGSTPHDVIFFFAKEYASDLAKANPGVIVTAASFLPALKETDLWKKSAIICCEDPYLAMGILSEKFSDRLSSVGHLRGAHEKRERVHSTAVVHPSVRIPTRVDIRAHVVIEEGAEIAEGVVIYPYCYVGPHVKIGKDSVLFPNVTLYEWTVVGERVRLHSGTVIGADGFGYAQKKMPQGFPVHQKIYHLGRVVIENDVEIGSNTSVDRGTFGDTRIGAMTKLDNQIQIGHNVELGQGVIICGNVAVGGSTKIGDFTFVGGQTGIIHGLELGKAVRVGAGTIVSKNVPDQAVVAGNPQRDHKEHFKAHAALNRLMAQRKSR